MTARVIEWSGRVGDRAVTGTLTVTVDEPATGPYRAFTPGSFWNQPIPRDAPLDRDHALWLADAQKNSNSGMFFSMGDFAQPFYWATDTDPTHTVHDTKGRSVTLRVPDDAAPMVGNDAEFTVFDLGMDVCAGFHHAHREPDGTIVTEGLDKWRLSSNGLASKLAQADEPTFNEGHRGSPAPLRGIRVDEVRDHGLIPHKVSVFWWATHPSVYFPMSGYESGKGGIVPEGVLVRLRPDLDVDAKVTDPYLRVIAKAWQTYGVYVGDNSGSSSRVKLERSPWWASVGFKPSSLAGIPWSDWQFIQRGFGA